MGFLARLLSLVLAAALATACSGPITNVAPGNPATRAIGPSGGAATGNEIAAGDRLRIAVFGDDRMSGEYNVDESGAITIPLGGPISVAGRTAENAAAAIASVLVTAGLFRDPKVTVEIVTLRPFYILGEVNRPGEYPYRPGMSLFAAVATAGGYTYRADSGTVFIRKATEKAEREYGISADIAIMPGDVIRIPERYF